LQVCSYTVAAGIDQGACTTYQGSMLPSDSITSVLRLNVSGSDRVLVGTGNGLFIPDDAAVPNGSGSRPLSVSVVSLAASATTLWTAGVDTLQSADLSAITNSSSWQSVQLGGGSLSLTHVAVGSTESVYLSGAAGLGRYTPSTHAWKLWRASSSSSGAPTLISDDVRSFAIARETIANSARDVIWLGTAAGVSRLDSQLDSFTTFTTDDGLPSNSVRAVIVLPNGNKLFGTDSGIALYKGQ
jgi:ligand-binding sensor domain-containing protein